MSAFGVGGIGSSGVFEVGFNLISLNQLLEVAFVVFPVFEVIVSGKVEFFVSILILSEVLIVIFPGLVSSSFESFNDKHLFFDGGVILD